MSVIIIYIMYGDTIYGDQVLTVNNQFVSGVQSVSVDSDFQQTPVKVAGIGYFTQVKNTPFANTIEVNRALIGTSDVLYNLLTGTGSMSGRFWHKTKNFSFNSGYCTSYELSCRVGELISTQSTINCYGEFKYLTDSSIPANIQSGISNPGTVFIPAYDSFAISLNDRHLDRIVGFSWRASLNKKPLNNIGSIFPVTVYPLFPMEIDINVSMEIDEDKLYEISGDMCNNYSNNITLDIRTRCSQTNVIRYRYTGVSLQNQKYSSSINNRGTLDLSYKTYFNIPDAFRAVYLTYTSGISGTGSTNLTKGVYQISGYAAPSDALPEYYEYPTVIGQYIIEGYN